MRNFVWMLALAGVAAAFTHTVGVAFGLPLPVRCLTAAIAGGIIGWIMRKLLKGE